MTLLMACALMAGWFCSFVRLDDIAIDTGGVSYGVTSIGGGLDFYRVTYRDSTVAEGWAWPRVMSYPIGTQDPMDLAPWPCHEIEWRWDFMGFHVGVANLIGTGQPIRRDQDCMVPYWSIILPLTLLSAYLILWKPRKLNKDRQP